MNNPIEAVMYGVSQLFLYPVLVVIALAFAYAFYALGGFLWQLRFGRSRELVQAAQMDRGLGIDDLEAMALKRLELPRLVSRVAPMLGLVATMIPMGPALKALADGQLADVSRSLMVAFSAVILALIAASITFSIVHVRRRWYAEELQSIERARRGAGSGSGSGSGSESGSGSGSESGSAVGVGNVRTEGRSQPVGGAA